ncbi:AT-rich interactive domain-containing protein 6-like [Coffea eugenioides]|uniref:AT-rich interactive domain-containing protein 6-like isoform X2 n=1 Tax=Coffea arabica TaxID=13443 RepID=A0ABM4VSD7_COFAR|nr:AT-rich interactive domain-containing protein 6-like [Coffea eugenioides]
MAADSTTDDTSENQQSGVNAIGASNKSNDDIGLNQPPQVNLTDFPQSHDIQNAEEVIKEEVLLPCDRGDNSAEILEQELGKPDIQSVDVQSKDPADLIEENDGVHSPGAARGPLPCDTETIDFEGQSQKIEGKVLDGPNQDQNSAILDERPLELEIKHEKAQQQKDGFTGAESSITTGTKEMDMEKSLTCVRSSSAVEPEEAKLITGLELVTDDETTKGFGSASAEMEVELNNEVEGEFENPPNVQPDTDMKTASNMLLPDRNAFLGNESETEENQAAFMKELEAFHKERFLEFKPPKFYGEPLNCLKLWRAVIKLGGYEQVTACKLWRQVGESFNPPKTCTTVSWTFRGFYEKALLEYEKHKMRCGELPFTDASFVEPSGAGNQAGTSQSSGSGRARRDAAARAMQGWHSQRLLGNGEVGDPIIKDKNLVSTPKREKQLKSVGLLKRKKASPVDHPLHGASMKVSKPQLDTMVVDIGNPADWVKINVQRTKDCFEVYALVPGLLREEVRVQSDPAGRLVISGQPEQLDNPWGVTPFKKVVSLPSRIDPHQTSAVVTLHGQLFVRVPFEQSDT